ncbi:hypothetical protein LCGC14_2114790 [marine sediment metagenome]|uniref:Lipoprotein n=1 Tax=marine sediment metagenome TaxID=412755 RepID=A0A0F9GJ33_9ZZZZ
MRWILVVLLLLLTSCSGTERPRTTVLLDSLQVAVTGLKEDCSKLEIIAHSLWLRDQFLETMTGLCDDTVYLIACRVDTVIMPRWITLYIHGFTDRVYQDGNKATQIVFLPLPSLWGTQEPAK